MKHSDQDRCKNYLTLFSDLFEISRFAQEQILFFAFKTVFINYNEIKKLLDATTGAFKDRNNGYKIHWATCSNCRLKLLARKAEQMNRMQI